MLHCDLSHYGVNSMYSMAEGVVFYVGVHVNVGGFILYNKNYCSTLLWIGHK